MIAGTTGGVNWAAVKKLEEDQIGGQSLFNEDDDDACQEMSLTL